MDITSEGLVEMYDGDFADMCAKKYLLMDGGTSAALKRAQTEREDPHCCERKFLINSVGIK